jgi:hypothetical protein
LVKEISVGQESSNSALVKQASHDEESLQDGFCKDKRNWMRDSLSEVSEEEKMSIKESQYDVPANQQ